MAEDSLVEFVVPLARLFDDNLRQQSKNPNFKGWGQFVLAESHADQIGLYGTSAGILVKTLANPSAHIDPGVIDFVNASWLGRSDPEAKYFHQNIRLAFFLMAIARSSELAISGIRLQAADELVHRQLTDGGWGDWWQSETEKASSPRLITTAWAILALERARDDRHKDTLIRAGKYLQEQVLGYADIEKAAEPILLCAIVRALPANDIHKRVQSAATAVLRYTRPLNDIQIYFFDYRIGKPGKSQVKRDFLCVPAFLSYSLLSSSLDLSGTRSFLAQLFVQLAHGRTVEHLKGLRHSLPFKNPGSNFPATVDQAFLSLAFEVASARKVRFRGFFKIARAIRNRLQDSWIVRVIIPLLFATLLAASAKDPNNLWHLYEYVSTFYGAEFRSWVERYNSVIQTVALGVSFFVGSPLVVNMMKFIQGKLRI